MGFTDEIRVLSMQNDYFVIFGAAVQPGGKPSGSLRRRVEGALALAGDREDTKFLVTGGVGRYGPSEALVMKELLMAGGIVGDRIVADSKATDTLSSVLNCRQILESLSDVRSVTVCSSTYHNLRCRLLFRVVGIKAESGRMPSDLPALGWRRLTFYHFREAVAILYDTVLLLGVRLSGRLA